MEVKSSPLPKSDQSALNSWLQREEFEILMRVLSSIALEKEAQAVNHLITGTVAAKGESEALVSEARDAYKVQAVLKKIKESQQQFIFTANPKK